MSPVFATRRRADEFDAVVEGRSARASDGRHDDLLVLVGALRAVPEPQARPDFVADLRARLVAEAETMPARAENTAQVDRLRLRTPDPGRVRNPRERRAAIALGTAALVASTATVSVASQSALPGDLLYPLKRGIENVHAGISLGDEGKGTTLLSSATTRLEELTKLAQAGGDQDPAVIADTLDDFTQQATEASDHLLAAYAEHGDETAVTDLRTFAATSMGSLADLDGQLPESAEDEWMNAVTTLVSIDDEARLACPTCEGPGLEDVTPTLPGAGTGYDTGALPAVHLPDLLDPTGLTLPSVDPSALPPGSVHQPGPSAGPSGGPGAGPTGLPTKLPTPIPTSGLPTALSSDSPPSLPSQLPSVGLTQLLDDLTGGPSAPVPLPSVGVTELVGGAGSAEPTTLPSALPTELTSPIEDLLD
jgi:hypothetical protein